MDAHYTYLDSLLPQVTAGEHLQAVTDIQKLITAVAVAIIFILIGRAVVGLRSDAQVESAIIPKRKISLFSWVDFLMESFIQYHDSVVGPENRHHAPFAASIFFFIFFLNLLGLVPGMPVATTTVWLNVGMALVVFFHFNYQGIRSHGAINYFKHFMGPVWWLAPLIFVIEIISTCIRVLTLNLRLYWNMSADHIVLGVFSDILSPAIIAATPFYFIGLFVSFMQAFVFTTLTMVYILLATQHEEEGHASH